MAFFRVSVAALLLAQASLLRREFQHRHTYQERSASLITCNILAQIYIFVIIYVVVGMNIDIPHW
jgi:hypothetical protein